MYSPTDPFLDCGKGQRPTAWGWAASVDDMQLSGCNPLADWLLFNVKSVRFGEDEFS